MKILKLNKYNFLSENWPKANESSEFADVQLGLLSNPLGPGYGFATDPQLTIYDDKVDPYIDNYSRMSQVVTDLGRILKSLNGKTTGVFGDNIDYFMEDVDEYKNLKILRIFENQELYLDVFISFSFMEEEFFGVYRSFNGLNKANLDSDLFSDPRFSYINKEYYIKLNNYLYKLLTNWFVPSIGKYKILSDELITYNSMGDKEHIKKGATIEVKGYNIDSDNRNFLMIRYGKDIFKIIKNDFYFFKYRCKKF